MTKLHDSQKVPYHYHDDERGLPQRCYHYCRHRWYVWGPILFAFQVLMFPLEHRVAQELYTLPGLEQIAERIGYHND